VVPAARIAEHYHAATADADRPEPERG
jgi:hypothetical protein